MGVSLSGCIESTIDLDREVFSVNNGGAFQAGSVPHIDWIGSLAHGRLGDQISVLFVEEDTMGLAVEAAELSGWGFGVSKSLDVSSEKTSGLRFAEDM